MLLTQPPPHQHSSEPHWKSHQSQGNVFDYPFFFFLFSVFILSVFILIFALFSSQMTDWKSVLDIQLQQALIPTVTAIFLLLTIVLARYVFTTKIYQKGLKAYEAVPTLAQCAALVSSIATVLLLIRGIESYSTLWFNTVIELIAPGCIIFLLYLELPIMLRMLRNRVSRPRIPYHLWQNSVSDLL